jgi:hypothetical protein
MRVTDKHVFFWGEWPSNWYKCYFTADGHEFFNSEQYFMWVKAKTFGDDEVAEEILKKGKNPKTAKALGRKVKNYDDKIWDEKRYGVMVQANMYKYSQNEELKALLLNEELRDKNFVEASPYDGIFGIKCGEQEALDDKSNWNGRNLLGKALDEVRNILLHEKYS